MIFLFQIFFPLFERGRWSGRRERKGLFTKRGGTKVIVKKKVINLEPGG